MDVETIEANKAMMRRWVEEGVNQGRLAAYDVAFADQVLSHAHNRDERRTVDDLRQGNVAVRAAFPDRRRTVDDLIAEGDRVVLRFTDRGTHLGAYAGYPPTGQPMTLTGILIWRVQGGKVVETWLEEDMLSVMQQFEAAKRSVPVSPTAPDRP